MNQKQFFNVYQPIVDARDGSLSGVEVLLRWQHPVAGLINPAEFIGRFPVKTERRQY